MIRHLIGAAAAIVLFCAPAAGGQPAETTLGVGARAREICMAFAGQDQRLSFLDGAAVASPVQVHCNSTAAFDVVAELRGVQAASVTIDGRPALIVADNRAVARVQGPRAAPITIRIEGGARDGEEPRLRVVIVPRGMGI